MQNEFNQMDLSKREQKVHVLNKGFLWKDLWYAMSRPGKNICPLNLCAKHRDDSSSVRYKLILNEDGLPCEREFRSTLLHVLLSFSGYKNHPFFAPPLPPQTWWPRIPSYLRTIWLVDPSGPWCRSLRCNVRLGVSDESIHMPYASLRIQFQIFFKHIIYLCSICKEGNRQLANYRNTFGAF